MAKPAAKAAQLRVLHLHSTFDAGGKERRAALLMNAWGKSLRHAVVASQPQAMGAKALLSPDLQVGFPFGFPPLAGKFSVKRMRLLARAMQDFDLVLTYNWGAMDAVMAHALFARTMALPPLVHHEDGFNADEASKLSTRRNWYRMIALSRTSALVVPSQRLEQIALGTWRQPPARVVRIPNGIDTAAFAKKPDPKSLHRLMKREGETWVGTIAGLRPVKNLVRLVQAFAMLEDRFHLVIFGEGPERGAIMAEAERLSIQHRVHLPGFVADPAKVMGFLDIFALSSDSEQFPLSVVEAMAAGLPVASPAVGDVADIVAPGNREFIVAPGSTEALGEALRTLGDLPDLRAEIGEANRARARAEFDAKAMVGRYAELYARVLGRERFP